MGSPNELPKEVEYDNHTVVLLIDHFQLPADINVTDIQSLLPEGYKPYESRPLGRPDWRMPPNVGVTEKSRWFPSTPVQSRGWGCGCVGKWDGGRRLWRRDENQGMDVQRERERVGRRGEKGPGPIKNQPYPGSKPKRGRAKNGRSRAGWTFFSFVWKVLFLTLAKTPLVPPSPLPSFPTVASYLKSLSGCR